MPRRPVVMLDAGPAVVLSNGEEVELSRFQGWLVSLVYVHGATGISADSVTRLLWGRLPKSRAKKSLSQLVYSLGSACNGETLISRVGDRLVPMAPAKGLLFRVRPDAPTAEAEFVMEQKVRQVTAEHLGRLWKQCEDAIAAGELSTAISILEEIASIDGSRAEPILDAAWLESRLGRFRSAELRLLRFIKTGRDDREVSRIANALEHLRRGLPLPASGPQSNGCGRPTFIGRSSLITLLRNSLGAKEVSHVLVYGEAGIGRSRTLAEFLMEVSLRRPELKVAAVQATAADRGSPYSLATRLAVSVDPEGHGVTFDPKSDDLKSFTHRIASVLVPEHNSRGLVVGIDDLHNADPSSLLVIRELCARYAHAGWTLISTVLADPDSHQSPVEEYLSASFSGILTTRLGELESDDAQRLLSEVRPSLSEGERLRIIRTLGGHPGLLCDRKLIDQVIVTGDFAGESVLANVAKARLRHLLPDETLLGRILGLLRSTSSVERLVSITNWDPIRVLRALESLVQQQVLERAGDHFSVKSPLIRTALRTSMTSGEKRLIHQLIVERSEDKGEASLPEIAYHTKQGGLPTALLTKALAREADRLENEGAFPEALEHLMSACGLDEGMSHRPLLERAGQLSDRLRRHRTAAQCYERAAEIAEAEGAGRQATRNAARSLMSLARVHPKHVDLSRVESILQDCIADKEWDAAAEILEINLWILDFHGDSPRTRRLLLEADRISPRTESLRAKAWVSFARARYAYLGDTAQGLPAAEESVELARQTDDPWLTGRCLNRLLICLYFTGRLNLPEGAQALQTCDVHIQESGDDTLRQDVRYNLANWYVDTGDCDAAQVHLEDLMEGTLPKGSAFEDARLWILKGEIQVHQGHAAEALECFRQAESTDPGLTGSHRVHSAAGKVLALLELGRIGEAMSHEQLLWSIGPNDRLSHNPSLIALARARLRVRQGKVDAAVDDLTEFAKYLGSWMVPGLLTVRLEQFRLQRRSRMQILGDESRLAFELAASLSLDRLASLLRPFCH